MDATVTPLLSVRDLSVAFRHGAHETVAVDRVSFELAKGETLALVGESGSGKSATALSIMKLLPYPSARHPCGEVHFKGRDLIKLSDREMRRVRGDSISIVFQEPMTSLNPLHTIEKQISEVLLLHRGLTGATARKRVVELLTQVGIHDPKERLGSYPHQLSGGQRQRVMIAMALANEPDLLIADEPTTALDVTVQAQILKLLKEIQARMGMAILFITHDLGIVRKIADRVCIMQQGKIVEHGTVANVFRAPEHPYTRALLSAEPKGKAPPLNPNGPVIVRTDDLKVWFPIKRGLLRRTVGHIKAVDGVTIEVRKGETLGIVGESGLGQDDPGARAFAPDFIAGSDRVYGQVPAGSQIQANAAIPARHADRVPGPLWIIVAAHVGLQRDRGRAVGASAQSQRRGTRPKGHSRIDRRRA